VLLEYGFNLFQLDSEAPDLYQVIIAAAVFDFATPAAAS
jgi:hypothetical protein